MFNIREMELEDIEQVAEIEKAVFSSPWSSQSFESFIKGALGQFFVAETGNEIIGYCGAYKILPEAEITNVAVSDEYRRMGVAQKLIEEQLGVLKSHNTESVFLEVRESNMPARKLYEKEGFKIIATRKNYYEKPKENAVVMKLQFE